MPGPDTPISGLPADANVSGTEKIPALDGANDVAITTQQIKDFSITDLAARVAALEGGSGGTNNPNWTNFGPPNGTVGVAFSYTFVAQGPPTPTYSIVGGSIPAGLALNSATGVLSGTPTTATTYNFTIRATNTAGIADQAVSITIAASPPGLTAPNTRGYGSVGFTTCVFNDEYDGLAANGANGFSSGVANVNGANSRGINLTRWDETWFGSANQTSQAVNGSETAGYDPTHLSISANALQLSVTNTAMVAQTTGKAYSHTGCILTTRNKFTWNRGFFEYRMWMPCGGGVLINNQAGWLNENANASEPDMYENLSGNARSTIHNMPHGNTNAFSPASSPTVSGWHEVGFHVAAVGGAYTVYWDKVNIGTGTAASDSWYMTFIHGTGPSIWGPDNLPATMQVEFFRVWQ